MPHFTVLLPTHNRIDVLRLAIASVLAQSFQDFELFIVADGCTDGTIDYVRGLQDARIRLFDLPKGPGFGYNNRNLAVREARGEWVAYMAHDNLWLPDHLEILRAPCARPENEFVYTRPLYFSRSGIFFLKFLNYNDPLTLRQALAADPNVSMPLSTAANRRTCFQKYGYWDAALPRAADADFHARVLRGGSAHNFEYLPIVTGIHFVADWRKESWRTQFRLALRQRDGSLPSALRVTLPPNQTEQKTIWRHLSADPSGWTRSLRRATDLQLEMDAAGAHPSTLVNFLFTQFHRAFG